ncbi:hypothetical protein J8L86_07625 [Shewanella sp. MMG014]|uniref:hypothetical protein n=1 Tax=Shewanella sp. MMG014 TaxID=2822691 RepID=UPI001B36C69D|nr:hypothetical protein [Shewanella sp. MMG014]MBQ4889712.1 hypothetical protein [Shewanella sp. MMG014]
MKNIFIFQLVFLSFCVSADASLSEKLEVGNEKDMDVNDSKKQLSKSVQEGGNLLGDSSNGLLIKNDMENLTDYIDFQNDVSDINKQISIYELQLKKIMLQTQVKKATLELNDLSKPISPPKTDVSVSSRKQNKTNNEIQSTQPLERKLPELLIHSSYTLYSSLWHVISINNERVSLPVEENEVFVWNKQRFIVKSSNDGSPKLQFLDVN